VYARDMSPRAHATVALFAFALAALACKHTYTPPGSVVDASVDVAEERDDEASGKCDEKQYANFKCLTRGRAAFCKTVYLHEHTRDTRTRGEWATFTCPDCARDPSRSLLTCSNVVPGEPCHSFVVEDMCAPDKHAVYTCDAMTNEWKMQSCSGGCTHDPPFKPRCKD